MGPFDVEGRQNVLAWSYPENWLNIFYNNYYKNNGFDTFTDIIIYNKRDDK